MKKTLAILLSLALLLAFAGCTAVTPDSNTTAGTQGNEPPAVNEHFTLTYNNVTIQLHADMAPILNELGDPVSYTESTSCAFDGIDKCYYYNGLYIDTYPMGDKDYVMDFWFADDSVTTNEGLYIGAPESEVLICYPDAQHNGTNAYTLTKGDGQLVVIIKDGAVSSIQFAIILE